MCLYFTSTVEFIYILKCIMWGIHTPFPEPGIQLSDNNAANHSITKRHINKSCHAVFVSSSEIKRLAYSVIF